MWFRVMSRLAYVYSGKDGPFILWIGDVMTGRESRGHGPWPPHSSSARRSCCLSPPMAFPREAGSSDLGVSRSAVGEGARVPGRRRGGAGGRVGGRPAHWSWRGSAAEGGWCVDQGRAPGERPAGGFGWMWLAWRCSTGRVGRQTSGGAARHVVGVASWNSTGDGDVRSADLRSIFFVGAVAGRGQVDRWLQGLASGGGGLRRRRPRGWGWGRSDV